MSLRQLKFKPNVRSVNKNQQDDAGKGTPPVNAPVLSPKALDKAVSKKNENISQNPGIQEPAKETNIEIKSSKCTEKISVNEAVKPLQKTRRKPNLKLKPKNSNVKEIDKTISSCDILKSSFDVDEQEKCNSTSVKLGEKSDNYDSNPFENPISDNTKGSEIVVLQKRIVHLKSALKILNSQGSEGKTLENSPYAHKDQLFELSTLENKAPEKTNPQNLGKHVLPIQTLNSKPTISLSLKERIHRSSEIKKLSNSLTASHLSKIQLCSSRKHDLNVEEACSESDLYTHKNALKFSPRKKLLICADKKNATPENVLKENTFPVCENDSTSRDSSEIASNCSDASKKRETLGGKNNNAVHGSKSLRGGQIAGPFKPKLTNRSSRLVASSSFGKMGTEVRQQLAKKLKDSSPESAKLTMLDLIFYNPTTNPMPHGGLSDKKNDAETQDLQSEASTEETVSNISSGDENSQTEKEKPIESDLTPVPQLRISGDGKVILSQDSLTVDQSKGELSHDIEYLFDIPEKKNKKRTKKNEGHRWAWSYDDTVKFYVALNTVGSDFELMKSAFPDRSRSNLKSKFKREEKTHGSLIDKVMSHPSEFNLKDVLEELETEKKFEETLIPSCGKRKQGQNIRNLRKKHHLLNITPWGKEKVEGFTFGQVKKMFNEELMNENTEKSKEALPLQNNPDDNCPEEQASDKQNENDDSNPTKRKEISPEAACEPPRKRRVMRKPKKYHGTVENDEIKEQEVEKNPESKNIVINTKIDYGPLKVTRYIKLDLNNIDNPVELNETIAHDHNGLVDNKQVSTTS